MTHRKEFVGQTHLVTGASSGIGAAAAVQLAALGARVVLVARRADALAEVAHAIEAAGGEAMCYPADLSNAAGIDQLIAALKQEGIAVDVLVNNAGRSIRRPLLESLDRAHDFERTMQLNYHGPVRLTLALLPDMLARGKGHVVNVSSVAALMTAPRFAAYLASKSALDAFSRSLQLELEEQGITVSTINFPLVKTAMTAPTAVYKYLPQMDVDRAAGWIVDVIRHRKTRRTIPLAVAAQVATVLAPGPTLRWLRGFYARRNKRLAAQIASEAVRGA